MNRISFKKSLSTISLIQSYEDNTIWKKLLLVQWDNDIIDLSIKIDDFIVYTEDKMQEITEVPASWSFTYLNCKKIIDALQYIQNSMTVYKEALYIEDHNFEDVFNQWTNKIHQLVQAMVKSPKLIRKFKELKKLQLNAEQSIILDNWLYKYFEITVNIKTKSEYIKLSNQLDVYSKQFQQNHEEALWKCEYALFVPNDKADWLKGLSDHNLRVGKSNSKRAEKEGWIYYIDDTTANALLAEADNRHFRKKIYQNYQHLNSDKRILMNNDAVLRNILSTKQKVAHLYNKDNYSELVLSEYTINKTQSVYDYLDSLEYDLKPLVCNVKKNLAGQAAEDGIKDLQPWDIPYYYNKIKKFHEFHKSDIFADYFSLEEVWPKIIKFIAKKFDIKIIKKEYVFSTPENNLMLYELKDNRSDKEGYWLISPYDNYSKFTATQKDLLNAEYIDDNYLLPCVQYISLQITKGKHRTPLSHQLLLVLLHELGHALHSFFAPVQDSFSNSLKIGWDLIELPSQFLEHLVYDSNFIIPLSHHHKTGLKMSEEILRDIIEKEQFFQGYEVYQDILKYRANFWLHENFKPYSNKNPHKIVEERLAKEGVIYNIARDQRMIYCHHDMDYGSTGYIYLYSAQLAFQLFEFYMNNQGHEKPYILRNIYENIFNSKKNIKMKSYLDEFLDFDKVNLIKFLKKDWDIELYGISNTKSKSSRLNEILLNNN